MFPKTLSRFNFFAKIKNSRSLSIFDSLKSSPVIISSNKDIYTNLAIEHLLYSELRFDSPKTTETKVLKKPVVFIWTDEPSVVIGRHQNPWIESNVGILNKAGIKIARRHSGGGCVYHDENNINVSVIGHRNTFDNRQENLRFLASILNTNYGVKCEPNKRHDLIHTETGFKLTGSAAKLGKHNAYHHFTLLVDTDKEALYTSIRQKQQDFVRTNSSTSTRSTVINLKELNPDLNVQQVVSDLAVAYGKHYYDPLAEKPARRDRAQGERSDTDILTTYISELKSSDWIFGKTPKFKLEKILPIIESGFERQVKFSIHVSKGSFESIEVDDKPNESFKSLLGTTIGYKEAMVNISRLLNVNNVDQDITMTRDGIFGLLLLQMVHELYF